MTTKAEILKWFCTRSFFGMTCDHCRESGSRKCISYSDLADRIDSLVKSCPSELRDDWKDGWMSHCQEVENWKKDALS